MMTKKEFISQLTSLVEGYTDGLVSANNKLFHSGQRLTAEKQEWEQKYHSAMEDNKNLEEQNEGLRVEKQALLDVISEWKSENHSLNALNVTLSEKLQEERELRVNQYQDLLKQEQSSQNWQGNYYAMQQSKNSLAKELDVVKAKYEEACKVGNQWFEDFKKLTLHCEKLKTELEKEKELQVSQTSYADRYAVKVCELTEELEKKEKDWSAAFAAAEERYEDFKKRSDGILATMGENLQRKQEQIEALTAWKEGTEKVLDSMEEKLRNYEVTSKVDEETIELLATQKGELEAQLEALKQINSFQEHRIEVLSRKARKLQKKEKND